MIFLSLQTFAQSKLPTGLVFDDKKYNLSDRLSPALKFTTSDLPFFSLRRFTPKPGNQGSMGSCVGWSTGYAALTTAEAVYKNLTDQEEVTKLAKSPLYIYNQIKVNGCPNGAIIDEALSLVREKGDCLQKDFNPSDCNIDIPQAVHQLASRFKIKEYYALFDMDASVDQKVVATINSINSKKPVVIGMNVTNSIFNVGSDGMWNPRLDEPFVGGHAMCVIGYDNVKKRFEIINSWGAQWGSNGYFTVSYSDYGRLCKYAYQFTLSIPKSNDPVNLTGEFKFKKYDGVDEKSNVVFKDAPIVLNDDYYTLAESVSLNDFFRIEASKIKKDKYVYIFSLKPDKTSELIFPTERADSKSLFGVTVKDLPVVPADDAIISIPPDPNKGLSTDQSGDDILCILFSSEVIKDIDNLITQVKNSQGDFYQKLSTVFGEKLIPKNELRYNPKVMGVTASSINGTIAPIILKVKVN